MPPRDLTGCVLHDTHRIVRLIGRGGMGAVYEAAHVRLANRRFAVKVLRSIAMEVPGVYERFRREAEIATSLGHPNIVDVTDFYETDDGQPCMVMELLHGRDLEAVLGQRGRLRAVELLEILRQVGSALEAAHDQGIVHRDLKPANIFLTSVDGGVAAKLLDFGISKIRDSNTQLTGARDVLGTPHYMSPEQGSGDVADVDQTTDIFSLGIICYQALSGKLPFDAPTLLGVIYKICNEEPAPLDEVQPILGAAVAQAVQRAMAKQKARRYRRVGDFVEQLGLALATIDEPPWAAPLAQVLMPETLPPSSDPLGLTETLPPSSDPRGLTETLPSEPGPRSVSRVQSTLSSAVGEPRPAGTLARPRTPLIVVLGLALVGVVASTVLWSQRATDRVAVPDGGSAAVATLAPESAVAPDARALPQPDAGAEAAVDASDLDGAASDAAPPATDGRRPRRRVRRQHGSTRRRATPSGKSASPPRDKPANRDAGAGFNAL